MSYKFYDIFLKENNIYIYICVCVCQTFHIMSTLNGRKVALWTEYNSL